jgi:hypothetical protein
MSALAAALMLGAAGGALAGTGEFDELCAAGLAYGQKVKTDCSINETIDGKTWLTRPRERLPEPSRCGFHESRRGKGDQPAPT